MIRLALLISGGGSTAAHIVSASKNTGIHPVLVIASKATAPGIQKIKALGFDQQNIRVISPRKFKTVDLFSDCLIKECEKRNVNLIGQYGWLPLTPAKFIKKYKGRIINQHPGPLDSSGMDFGGKGMYGRRVHASVLYFRRVTGHDYWTEATAHFVTEEFDRGEVIGRLKVPISPQDTVESLREKVLPFEHKLHFSVLKKISEGKIIILKRKVPLINESELGFLNEAKKIALILYPHG